MVVSHIRLLYKVYTALRKTLNVTHLIDLLECWVLNGILVLPEISENNNNNTFNSKYK